MVEDKNKLVFQTYEKRAEEFIDKGYRNEVWYVGYKLLSDWTLLSRLDLTDRRVLNVGCSEPIDEMFWVRKVKEWVAVDYSPKSIQMAKKIVENELSEKLARKIRFQIADATNLPFKNESFDIAVAFSTIEHIPDEKDREKAIKEMVRITNKGGYLVITVPNKYSLFYFEHRRLMKSGRSDYGFAYLFTRRELKKMLLNCGLVPLKFLSEMRIVGYEPLPIRLFNKIICNFGQRIGYIALKP